MIEQNLLDQIRNDFYMGPDHEYLLIDNANVDSFWNWIKENSFVYTELSAPENLSKAKFLASRCIGNSQVAAIDNEIEYLEGFARRQDRFIFHGFNVAGENVIDVTAINHPNNFEKFFGGVPNYYVGIKIPHEFLNEVNGEAIAENHININPLLYRFYLQQQ
ncbi:MAG: hypothetical protein J7577_01820 [Sphingobacteriaceae bacterium]|nr:hypothetical protein [Sphingobacteriaceae bacterium]